jgi:hypothetical protein
MEPPQAVAVPAARPESTTTSRSLLRRVIPVVISIAIVVGILAYALPRFAAMTVNLVTYWLANMAALPGLGLGHAAVLTQTTTSVANTLPAGGAIAVGLTYRSCVRGGTAGRTSRSTSA